MVQVRFAHFRGSPPRAARRGPSARARSYALVTAVICASPAAWGADHELSRTSQRVLALEFGVAALLAGATLMWSPPTHCSWCRPPAFDEVLARPVAFSERRVAAQMSDVLSFTVVPTVILSALIVPPLTTPEPDVHLFQNLQITGAVVALDAAITRAVKNWSGRRRPAFFYARTAHTEYATHSRQGNVSFFSGHTSVAFAAAAAAATLSFQRGYRSAPYVTVAGAGLAAGAGLLRIAADVHWASDVLTGALVGTGLGVALPLLLHPRVSSARSSGELGMGALTSATPAPAMLRLSGAF